MEIPKHLEKYRNELELKNYSENTVRTYVGCVKLFLNNFSSKPEPKKVTVDEVKGYLRASTSVANLKQNVGAIKKFYQYVVKQPLKFKYIEYPRSNKVLPRVIDHEDLVSKLNSIDNIKHKAILSLAYCCGLRVSEIVNLRITHIDGKNKVILVSQAKGNKDRYVPVSDNILGLLRGYFRVYSPKEYLFNGQNSLQYSVKSCQLIFKKYVSSKYSFHHLRHSSFTTMLENGTDIRVIQVVAGHSSPNTTAVYCHVSRKFLQTINTPI